MRKLHVLKSLVDFIFVILSFTIPFILIGIPAIFFMNESSTFKIIGLDFNQGTTFLSKIFIAIYMITYVLIYVSIFKFRSLLSEFKKNKVFSNFVVKTLKEIGDLLLISGILMVVAQIGFKITSVSKIVLDLGVNSHYLCICFGLFFLVLSEIFKISKELKNENDLTI